MASLMMNFPQPLFNTAGGSGGTTPAPASNTGTPGLIDLAVPQLMPGVGQVNTAMNAEHAIEQIAGNEVNSLFGRVERLYQQEQSEAHRLLSNEIKRLQAEYMAAKPDSRHVTLFNALFEDFNLPPEAIIYGKVTDENGNKVDGPHIQSLDFSKVGPENFAALESKGFTPEEIELLQKTITLAYEGLHEVSTQFALVDVAMLAPEEMNARIMSQSAQDSANWIGPWQTGIGTVAGAGIGGALVVGAGAGLVALGVVASAPVTVPLLLLGAAVGGGIGYVSGSGGISSLIQNFNKAKASSISADMTTQIVDSDGDLSLVNLDSKGHWNDLTQQRLTGGANEQNYQQTYYNLIERYKVDASAGVFTRVMEELKKTPEGVALATKMLNAYQPEILSQRAIESRDTPQAEVENSKAAIEIIKLRADTLMQKYQLNGDTLIRWAKLGYKDAKKEMGDISEEELNWLLAHGTILHFKKKNSNLTDDQLVAQFGKSGLQLLDELQGGNPTDALKSISGKMTEGWQGFMNWIGGMFDSLVNDFTSAFRNGGTRDTIHSTIDSFTDNRSSTVSPPSTSQGQVVSTTTVDHKDETIAISNAPPEALDAAKEAGDQLYAAAQTQPAQYSNGTEPTKQQGAYIG